MAEFELRGYLTTGKFHVNDYTIEIERVENGLRMTIDDGKGGIQSAVIRDGEPGLSEDEQKAIRELFEKMSTALPEWEDEEEKRKAAEKLRELAENGPAEKADPESDEDKLKYRQGLYELMLALYNRLYPKIDDDLAAAEAAKDAAEAARDAAADAARDAALQGMGAIARQLFYYNGDQIKFGRTNEGPTVVSVSMNVSGYVDASGKTINLKIPVAKRLDNITDFSCQRLIVHIVNSGGYAMEDKYKEGGHEYKGNISSRYVDRVQNCLHLQLSKTGGWKLNPNECVSCRIGTDRNGVSAVCFTLIGENAPAS